jgi:predicted nucleic acid-binding protein
MIVVADSTPLIALASIDQFNLLKGLFGTVLIPEAVFREVVTRGRGRPGSEEVRKADWIKVQAPKDRAKVVFLLSDLDEGEAEALVLAEEVSADWIIVDETKARLAAEFIHLHFIGTVGVLLLAKKVGKIPIVRPLLDHLKTNKFYISESTYSAILEQAGE